MGANNEVEMISKEATKAFAASAEGKHKTALNLIRKSCERFKDSGYLHRVFSEIALQSNLDNESRIAISVDEAKKAVELEPKSIKFHCFLAGLLFKRSIDMKSHLQVIKICDEALKIQEPNDNYLELIIYKADLEHLIEESSKMISVIRWWKSSSTGMKDRVLKVRIDDLDSNLLKALSQALLYFKRYKKWEFWECGACSKRFSNSEKYLDHVHSRHSETLVGKNRFICSRRINRKWIKMITEGKWKPVDSSATMAELELHCQWLVGQTHDLKKWGRGYFITLEWPTSDDSERKVNLAHIQSLLQILLSNKAILAVHMSNLSQYAIHALDDRLCVSLERLGLDQAHLCICLLETPQLKEILNYLQEIMEHYLEISRKKFNVDKAACSLRFESNVKMDLKGEPACLHIEVSSLSGISNLGNIPREGTETSSSDAMLQWIYSSRLSSTEIFNAWTDSTSARKRLWQKDLRKLEKVLQKRETDFNKGKNIQSVDTSQQETLTSATTAILHLSQIDLHVMRISQDLHQWELKLKDAAAGDYRVLCSLVKPYIQAHLEETVKNDAREKSEAAARHAGLATSKRSREAVDEVGPRLSRIAKTTATREAEQVDPTVEECDTEALRQLRSEEIKHQSDL